MSEVTPPASPAPPAPSATRAAASASHDPSGDAAPSLRQLLLAEQLRLYQANVLSAVAGSLAVGAVLLFVMAEVASAPRLAAVALGIVVATALRLAAWAHGRQPGSRDAAGEDAAAVRKRGLLRLAVAANGLAFGFAGALLFPVADLPLQYFLAFVLAGMTAGSLTLTAFDPVAARSFALLAMLPLLVQLLTSAEAIQQALGLLLAMYMALLMYAGRRIHRNLCETLANRLAAARRAAAIEDSERRMQQVADELARKSATLELTLQSMDQGILSLGEDGRVNAFNARLLELTDLPADLLASRPTIEEIARHQAAQGHFGSDQELMDDTGRPHLRRWLSGEPLSFPPLYHRRTRQGRVLQVKSRPVGDRGLVRTFTDVTDYVLAQQRLADSDAQARKLALVAAHTDNAVVIADAELRIEWVNEAFTRLSGYRLDEVVGRRAADVLRDKASDEQAARRFDEDLRSHRRAAAEMANRAKDGRVYWVALETHGITDDDGRIVRYVSTARDITERRLAEAALMQARNEAERANRAKSDFLSAMSHELRTPLNAILGFGQLLAADPARQSDSQLQTYTREIVRAGEHLLTLINDVLDLARVEAGGMPVRLEPVALRGVVEDSLRLLQPLARERDLQWPDATEVPPQAQVTADRTRLTQVLLNLLSNAIKYNREAGRVVLRAERSGQGWRLSVRDDGPGLDERQRERLFQSFERLGADLGGVQGAGIGLMLSRRLMELMHGGIGVDSEPGVGSTFWIQLPQAAEPTPAMPQQLSLLDEPPPPPAAPRRRRLLYIEDNPVNVVLMEAMLAQAGDMELRSAEVPELGLELARLDPPDLVLLDIQLPGMDGYEVLRRLRRHKRTRAIPVLAISANAAPGDIERGLAAGFDGYLTKPLELKALIDAVARLLPR